MIDEDYLAILQKLTSADVESKKLDHWMYGRDHKAFTAGLAVTSYQEKIDERFLSSIDGFIAYQGMLKKDFNLTNDTSLVVDNIVCNLYTDLLTCLVEEDEETPPPQDYPEDESEFNVTPDDYMDDENLRLCWYSGIASSINQGKDSVLTVLNNHGDTAWWIACSDVSLTKLDNTHARITAGWYAEGPINVYCRDAFRVINTSITVPEMDWVIEPSNMNGDDAQEVVVKNSLPFFEGPPEWYVDTTQFTADDETPSEKAVNGVYITGITEKYLDGGFVVNRADIISEEGASAYVTITCKDANTTLEKEILVYSNIDGSDNPDVIDQDDYLELTVTGGIEDDITWSVELIGTSSGFFISGSGREGMLTTSADAAGSCIVVVTDNISSYGIEVYCVEHENTIDPNAIDATGQYAGVVAGYKTWSSGKISSMYVGGTGNESWQSAHDSRSSALAACWAANEGNEGNCCSSA